MARVQVHSIRILEDNYGYILEDTQDKVAVIVDPGEAAPLLSHLEKLGSRLIAIWNTHHHADHIAGNKDVLTKFVVPVYGSAKDQSNIPELTHLLSERDTLNFADRTVQILEIPGHTLGHIAFYVPGAQEEPGHLFLGDLIFGLSCGNVMEGHMSDMFASISKVRQLPDHTLAYCGHEYTLNNRRWATHVEPNNRDTAQRVATQTAPPTIPLNLGQEKKTNPFLRCDGEAARAYTGKTDPAEVFAQMRLLKNSFK